MTSATEARKSRTPEVQKRRQPRYHVILLDDDDHTYEYVIDMLAKLFFMNGQDALIKAREVDTVGRVILDTTTKERAEFKQEQVHAYGKDHRVSDCQGAMTAVIEPAPE